jgi:putative Mn2+ efflux pump MntP
MIVVANSCMSLLFSRKQVGRSNMGHYISYLASIILIGLGIWMATWPATVVRLSRDNEEKNKPLNTTEVWVTRLMGIAVALLGFYMLNAEMNRIPGVEFFPV